MHQHGMYGAVGYRHSQRPVKIANSEPSPRLSNWISNLESTPQKTFIKEKDVFFLCAMYRILGSGVKQTSGCHQLKGGTNKFVVSTNGPQT